MIKTQVIEITDPRLALVHQRVFTSAEGDNPGGSVKDHMVFNELSELLRLGRLKKNDWVSEVSSGSTALSLAFYCYKFDLSCHLFIPETMSNAKKRQLESFGARLHAHPMNVVYQKHNEFLIEHPQTYFFNQLMDETKIRHYENLARSFLTDDAKYNIVIGAVGTGHSLKGLARIHNQAELISAEPAFPETCLGVRNIEHERFGPTDPCRVENFKNRIIVKKQNYFPTDIVETSHGPLRISESFRLVLGAIQSLNESKAYRRILALGAQNQFFLTA